MTSLIREVANSTIGSEANEEMLAYGITRVPVDHFYYRDYRYTRLIDAIAQAKREESRLGGPRAFTLGAFKSALK